MRKWFAVSKDRGGIVFALLASERDVDLFGDCWVEMVILPTDNLEIAPSDKFVRLSTGTRGPRSDA